MAKFDFDLFVLGAGSGGVRAARLAAQLGVRVAVAEGRRVGGTCVMRGCVPKKLLVMGAHYAEDLADAEGFGWTVEGVSFDWARLIAAKNAELNRLEGVYKRILRDNGVTLVEGKGRLLDPHTIEVAGRTFTAERILIATGGRPVLPATPGIEHVITSDEALDLMQLPERMVVVGGGYIGVEFAGIFNALGVKVTLIQRGDALLRGFDQDVRTALSTEMAAKGVTLRCETTVRSIEKCAKGYSLRLSGDEEMEADLVLYATGRRPNTDGLGLEEAGVELDERGAVVVDAWSQTNVKSVYAIGDVTDRMNLTPVALGEARALVSTLYLNKPQAMDYDNVPTAVFSMPPVGTVGLSEEEARRRGHALDVYLSRFKPMRNTLSGRDERTLVKLVVDKETDRVLGAHMVGPDSPEVIQGFAVAVKMGATKAQFDATVGVHPSVAEELVTLREKRPDPAPECEE